MFTIYSMNFNSQQNFQNSKIQDNQNLQIIQLDILNSKLVGKPSQDQLNQLKSNLLKFSILTNGLVILMFGTYLLCAYGFYKLLSKYPGLSSYFFWIGLVLSIGLVIACFFSDFHLFGKNIKNEQISNGYILIHILVNFSIPILLSMMTCEFYDFIVNHPKGVEYFVQASICSLLALFGSMIYGLYFSYKPSPDLSITMKFTGLSSVLSILIISILLSVLWFTIQYFLYKHIANPWVFAIIMIILLTLLCWQQQDSLYFAEKNYIANNIDTGLLALTMARMIFLRLLDIFLAIMEFFQKREQKIA